MQTMAGAMDFREEIKEFLRSLGFLPLVASDPTWRTLPIKHVAERPLGDELQKIRAELKRALGGVGGIYIYLDDRERVLYVGKAADLYSRVYDHYRLAFESLAGDRKGIWHEFFGTHVGDLVVLWRPIDNDRQRHIFEQMIQFVVGSEFEKKYPRGSRVLGGN